MPTLRVLLIEDNTDLAANLVDYLGGHGHAVDAAADGMAGLALAQANDYDVVVLDVVLPRLDGIGVCRRLRAESRRPPPVLMLTARDSLEDKIAGLEAGADDYVVKPFAMREVEVRLRALARRGRGDAIHQQLAVGDLTFDTATFDVRRGGRPITLPPIPLKLLEGLMRASPRVLSRAALEQAVWGDSPPDSDALRAHLHILRSAVDRAGERPLLRTLRGLGWQITDA